MGGVRAARPPDPTDRPQLAEGVRLHRERLTGRLVLLFPEGLLRLNQTAARILGLCDSRRSVARIVASMAAEYVTPEEPLAAEVREYLCRLRDRQLIRFSPEEVS